jgi:aspartate beta-hydroxylase
LTIQTTSSHWIIVAEIVEEQLARAMQAQLFGLDALNRNDAAAARAHFEAATRDDPTAATPWLYLAKALRILGDDAAERAALESALETDQRNLMALIRLAELHERRGEIGEATARWVGVAALSIEHVSPAPDLRAIFDHAHAFLAQRKERLADAVEADFGAELEAASQRDRRRVRAAMDHMLGRRQIYTNFCHGMHYPFLPADEYFEREHFTWLGELEANTDVIRTELVALLASDDPGLSPYVTMPPGTPPNIWSELNNNAAWSALHLWKDGERIEGACARAPETARIVERLPLAGIPGRAPNVFFSILQAGKHIPPHTGVTNTRTIIHLPLIVPPGCRFRVGGETREWQAGQAFAFDDTIEHEAWNTSEQDRAVLILDCWNPYLSEYERAMICRLFAVSDAQNSA